MLRGVQAENESFLWQTMAGRPAAMRIFVSALAASYVYSSEGEELVMTDIGGKWLNLSKKNCIHLAALLKLLQHGHLFKNAPTKHVF